MFIIEVFSVWYYRSFQSRRIQIRNERRGTAVSARSHFPSRFANNAPKTCTIPYQGSRLHPCDTRRFHGDRESAKGNNAAHIKRWLSAKQMWYAKVILCMRTLDAALAQINKRRRQTAPWRGCKSINIKREKLKRGFNLFQTAFQTLSPTSGLIWLVYCESQVFFLADLNIASKKKKNILGACRKY